MRIIDITRPLSGKTVSYPGDTPPRFTQKDQGLYLISDLHMNSHAGTHIDAPVHYLKKGDTIDTLPMECLIGRCRVLDVSNAGSHIDVTDLKGRIGNAKRLLLKTTFSGEDRFREDYPSITAEAAAHITENNIRCVGIDSFSIESFICDGSVHRELLSHGCVVIELLDLSKIPEGDYDMVALPLRLVGLDGAPARVVLIEQEVDETWT